MEPVIEEASYAYYFNEKYVKKLTASDATLFDTAMTAYAADAEALGTGKRTMHGSDMTIAISRADLENAAFAMFPDFEKKILADYDPAASYHGGVDKDTYFIVAASDATYAMVAGLEEGEDNKALADVFVLGEKGDVLARYKVTLEKNTGKKTTYAYHCAAFETVWRAAGEDDFYLDQDTLAPVLESMGKDSFTDKWEKEEQDAACRNLLQWAVRNVNEKKEKEVRAALDSFISEKVGALEVQDQIRFLAVWPAVSSGVDELLASDELEGLFADWNVDMASVSAADAGSRWEILRSEIYDAIRKVGYGTVKEGQ